jgi:hypothetical protein
MKKAMLVLLVVFAAAALALAQTGVGPGNVGTIGNTTDVLGAHLGYGRGCVMCHAPHNGARGNNVATTDGTSGNAALWGQDLTPLYGQPLTFGDAAFGGFAVTLPVQPAKGLNPFDANTGILFCLSCHDGNLAKVGMMKGHSVETLAIVGGTAPTLLGNDGTTAGNYYNDHPVGGTAIVNCGGAYDWDCTGGNTVAITMNGTASAQFMVNYPGSFWNGGASFGTFGTAKTAVTCTTCHDQHSNYVYKNGNGNYATTFFVRGNYVPSTTGNNAAQFCRNCHGGESNEMHGVTGVPTT